MGISIHWQRILLASTRIRWKGTFRRKLLGLQSVVTRQRWESRCRDVIQTLINSSPLQK